MSSDARAIYQRVLDLLTEAILSEDGKTWERHMMVPHFMSTCDGKLVHETREDLLLGLKDFAVGTEQALSSTTITAAATSNFDQNLNMLPG